MHEGSTVTDIDRLNVPQAAAVNPRLDGPGRRGKPGPHGLSRVDMFFRSQPEQLFRFFCPDGKRFFTENRDTEPDGGFRVFRMRTVRGNNVDTFHTRCRHRGFRGCIYFGAMAGRKGRSSFISPGIDGNDPVTVGQDFAGNGFSQPAGPDEAPAKRSGHRQYLFSFHNNYKKTSGICISGCLMDHQSSSVSSASDFSST